MQQQLQAKLQQAMAFLRGGQTAAGETICRDILALVPNQPDALHLLAMSAGQRGDSVAAEQWFRKSLTAEPRQPAVLANMANLLGNLGRLDEAIATYRKAVALDSKFLNGWYNLGLALNQAGQHDEAIEVARRLTRLAPQMPTAWELQGAAYYSNGQESEALEAYAEGLKANPGNANLWYKTGLLHREMAEFEQAADAFEKAQGLGLDTPELYQNLAEVLYEARHIEKALAAHDDAIAKFPHDPGAHFIRAKFRWEAGQQGDHLAALRQAISERPRAPDLWGSYFDLLAHEGRYDDMLAELDEARGHCPGAPRLNLIKAMAESAVGRFEEATAGFEGVLALDPGALHPLRGFAEHLLKAGEYERADAICAEILEQEPLDITAWAFRGTAWQLMDDERAHWLLDFERMVQPVEVPLPDGYSDRAEYFGLIRDELEELHMMQAHPLDQTLRGGTQTNGFLFRLKNPMLQQLGRQMKKAVASVLTDFPPAASEPDHPFWGRNTGAVEFKGAWSVRLRSQGFHTSHIHPEGWISSALYIALPDVVHEPGTTEGHIQFGEPVAEMEIPLKPVRVIEPQVGRLVLFPSYMWHGTIPFNSDQPRITIAYDLLPG